MPILRANVDYAFAIARARDKKPYGYGGVWSKTDVNRTTDCSGIVTHVLDALENGEKMAWSRHGLSTEAYRYVGPAGSRGPFGTIRVARPQDIPADAALRIGLMHGPGGGANSHMACTLEGVAIESSGSYGQRVGGPARGYNHSMFHDWFYLPGPIVGSGTSTPATPTAPGAVYLGRDCSRYECTGERVKALQARLNRDYPAYSDLDEDGEFGPLTEQVVREFQSRSNLTIDGIAGPATLAALGLSFQQQPAAPAPAPAPAAPKPVVVGPADDQLTMRFNCLGGQTLVEAVAEIRDKVLGTDDRGKPGVVMK
ncbi:lysin A [Mycobacterium phage Xavia]|uniref:Lysin A n=2 Tax=Pclasvirinae TaxID=1982878 RepID=A0AAE7F877_9CAUD|nr:endolysin [Mycobacterium phage Jung]YP_009965233.1 endolysin [Mycobacterium phage Xavia]AWN02628.1 lysin A [Mycobacterium phage Xavia]QKY80185.1 lysin A [Mycobacterium phage Jung]